MRIRKIGILDEFPSAKVANKIRSVVLGEEGGTRDLTREDVQALIADEAFSKAPKTVQFLQETFDSLKDNGAYFLKITA